MKEKGNIRTIKLLRLTYVTNNPYKEKGGYILLFSKALLFYGKHFDRLLVISLGILLPLLLLQTFIVNYVYSVSSINGITFYGDLANALFTLLIVVIAQAPYIKYVMLEEEGEEKGFKKSLISFAEKAFSLYLFSVMFTLLVVFGSILLFIPGLILLVFFYLTPFVMIADNIKISKAMKKSLKIAKRKFFPILAILFLIGIMDWTVGYLTIYLSTLFTGLYFGVLSAKLIVSSAVYPLGIIYLTLYFMKWNEEMKEVDGLGDLEIEAV